MFDSLTKGFKAARQKLAGVAELSEANIDEALRDVRLSLLEADVELGVVKRFLAAVKEQALGTEVKTQAVVAGRKIKATPSDHFIKICQDKLVEMMSFEGEVISFAKPPLTTGIMMVGLQGAGKTTSAAKLARLLEKEFDRKVLLVAADVQRPGAIDQLQVLGERIGVPVFAIPGGQPVAICEEGLAHAKKIKRDTVIFDTAGRLAIDEPLMAELAAIKAKVKPESVLLTIDAMTGQDSVKTAASFHERLGLSGVILTKLDGDARGGAALSVKEVTGAPVRFAGLGEELDKLEVFRPDGMASRILGFGDVVGLMKDFEGVVDQEKAEADARRMLQGQFTLDDFLEQISMLQRMGPLSQIMEKLPIGDMIPEGANFDDRELVRTKAMVSSMTRDERRDIELFRKQPSRLTRVAKGSGRTPKEVAELLQRFAFMQQMMGSVGQQAGMLGRIPGLKQLAMRGGLKNAVRTSGLEGNPMMAGLAEELLQAAVADQGGFGGLGALGMGGGGGARRPLDKNKKKALRKMQKKARKKSRR